MIAVVTGANGFIGSHLAAELAARGHTVRAILRRNGRADSAPAAASGIETIRLDYDDAPVLTHALRDADVVFHAAGATRAPTPAALEAANVVVTRRVANAVANHGKAARLVLVSSQAAAGPAAGLQNPVTEDDATAPIEAYGRSKLAAEAVAAAAGIVFTVVRPAAVYGPRDRDFLQLFRLAARGIALHPANRTHWLSIVHVRDVVDGIMRAALEPAAAGRTYFLANEAPVQWSELFRLAATAAGRRLVLDVDLPAPIVDLGARLGDLHARATGKATLLTGEKVALSKSAYWVCSSERATRDLGFRPRVRLADGLAETYRWYAGTGWL